MAQPSLSPFKDIGEEILSLNPEQNCSARASKKEETPLLTNMKAGGDNPGGAVVELLLAVALKERILQSFPTLVLNTGLTAWSLDSW